MNCGLVTFIWFCFYVHSSLAVACGDIHGNLHYNNIYNAHMLSEEYYSKLQNISLPDAVRFEQLIAQIERFAEDADIAYCDLLIDMIEQDALEPFQILYPLLDFVEDYYEVDLMVRCLQYRKIEFLNFMYSHDFKPERFITAIDLMFQNCAEVYLCIKLVDFIASLNEKIKENLSAIFTDAIHSLLFHCSLATYEEDEFIGYIEELVERGANVTEQIKQAYKDEYPEYESLHKLLTDSEIPDVKQPDDCC